MSYIKNKLTVLSRLFLCLAALHILLFNGAAKAEIAGEKSVPYQAVILAWQPIDRAVSYNLRLIDDKQNVVWEQKDIFPTGYEINPEKLNLTTYPELYYQVQGVDLNKQPVSSFGEAKPLYQGRHFNRYWEQMQIPYTAGKTAPEIRENFLVEKDVVMPPLKTTGAFSLMGHFPVYPVFSWVKVPGATHYILLVEKILGSNQTVQVEKITLGDTYDYYGNHAYTDPGDYRYQIIATDGREKLAQSPWNYFHVDDHAAIVALGDSITHGGGAISTPPSQLLYNWESYTDYPILNAGYSGNTTSGMLRRMPRDVFTFHPQYLIVMGGINDLRLGKSAQEVISNLQAIKTQALNHNITPIFLTTVPLNYSLTREHVATPAPGWQWELTKVNIWINSQPQHLDVAAPLTDSSGELRREFTTDGLHPDGEGKKIIGEAVNRYLKDLTAQKGA